MPLPDAPRRVVLMVGELHRLGYCRLRLAAPAISPSGCHWQAFITAVSNTRSFRGRGDFPTSNLFDARTVAAYQTGQGDRFFGWADAATDTAAELARKFLDRFPDVAASGWGDDPAYIAWYQDMLAATEPAGLVYAYSPWGDRSPEHLNVAGESRVKTVPYPPPGELVARKPAEQRDEGEGGNGGCQWRRFPVPAASSWSFGKFNRGTNHCGSGLEISWVHSLMVKAKDGCPTSMSGP